MSVTFWVESNLLILSSFALRAFCLAIPLFKWLLTLFTREGGCVRNTAKTVLQEQQTSFFFFVLQFCGAVRAKHLCFLK